MFKISLEYKQVLENGGREFRKKRLLNKTINTFQMTNIVYSIAGYSTRKHLILDSDTGAALQITAQRKITQKQHNIMGNKI